MIRKVVRFDSALERAVLPRVPDCRNGEHRFAPWFLASLAALVLAPILFLTPTFGASPVLVRLKELISPSPEVTPPPTDTSDSTSADGTNDGAPQGTESSGKAAAKSEAAEAWDAVKDTTNPALLEAYIKR